MGRIVHSDLDCADCACRICARSTYNDCSNPDASWQNAPHARTVVVSGEWVEDDYGFIHCSICGMEWDDPEHPKTNFCPNCGADMREVKTNEK